MDHEQILKLVEECAAQLSPDPIAGVKKLEAEFKSDPNTLKGILGLIAINHKEHSKFIFNYLQVGYFVSSQGREKKYDDYVAHFPHSRELIITQLDTIDNLLQSSRYTDAEKTILEAVGLLEDLLHTLTLAGQVDKSSKQHSIHADIEAFRKKLDRLSDYIVVKNEDKIITEMAAIQKTMRALEAQIQIFLSQNF